MLVCEIDEPRSGQLGRAGADRDHAPQPGEDGPFRSGRVVAPGVLLRGKVRPVHPAAVRLVAVLHGVLVVVELPHLVAQVQERDAAGAERHRVGQQDSAHRVVGIVLQPAEGGRRPGNAAVAGARVVLERHAPGEAAGVAG